ncbi:MAG TPA: DNA polymerase IV [Candidatus Eisenbacteria bacterium]|nr:DNA polymerase IV [Candidatus Eisenbacteria bacterium]
MRIIVHVDMDAFYAAVEERLNPALRDLPVVVGADPKEGKGRGVVTTANYRARQFGIHSALPISRAWRRAEIARRRGEPATVFIQPNMSLYREVSGRVMEILERYADAFEEASIDEAYLDVSSLATFAAAKGRMAELKREIREREGLGCSIGIGPNKLIAKIASGRQKPDGLTVVEPEEVLGFLSPLPVRLIPGIGPKTEHFLRQKGLRTIEDLRQLPEATLIEWFGKWGARLFEKVRGIDDSEVSNDWTRKSLGEQETFEADTRDQSIIIARLDRMAERIIAKLLAKEFKGFRTVTLTVRFSDFQTSNRSRTLKDGVSIEGDVSSRLKETAASLLMPFFDARENPRDKAFRLIGLRVEKLF